MLHVPKNSDGFNDEAARLQIATLVGACKVAFSVTSGAARPPKDPGPFD
jgi:hypothetical protein